MEQQVWACKKVMITGASGFLGTRLSRRLSRASAAIHGVSRLPRDNTTSIHWWQGDLTDADATRRLVSDISPDIIFHFSGLATGVPDVKLVLPTFHSLVTSTVNLLTAVHEVGCGRLVLAASPNEPSSDNETPTSPYAAAKSASTAYGRMFHRLCGLPVVTARIFMTYGVGQRSDKLIPYIVRSFLQGCAPKLASGKERFDWIYIDDVVEGLVAASSIPALEGEMVDLGSGRLTATKELVERVTKVIGADISPLFGALPDRPLQCCRSANTEQTKALLGWSPVVSLDEGLRRTVNWCRDEFYASSGVRIDPSIEKRPLVGNEVL
jgi:nucleoside-diphosphate-sugar epimerase